MITCESDRLYHVKCTVIDRHHDPSGSTQFTDIIGTFTDLACAKEAARDHLFEVGYHRDWFSQFQVNPETQFKHPPPQRLNVAAGLNATDNGGPSNDATTESWQYGAGVITHALAQSGEEFLVAIDTTSNPHHFRGNATGRVCVELWYVLQTNTLYLEDRSGAVKTTITEGAFSTARSAEKAARETLLDGNVTKASFAEFDEQGRGGEESEDWEFGEDVLVHAVTENGQNTLVSVLHKPALTGELTEYMRGLKRRYTDKMHHYARQAAARLPESSSGSPYPIKNHQSAPERRVEADHIETNEHQVNGQQNGTSAVTIEDYGNIGVLDAL